MNTINTLSQNLISKIAAGEVVERPGSVVKELVENALDAKASFIDITLSEGGAKKIAVKDDGIGMNAEDILLSFKPHTTSKLSSEEDLFNIQSFGFRGEALASIAAVSRLTIKSRTQHSQSGYIVETEQGRILFNEPVGVPQGTEVIVESLFYALPARKKFLRDPSQEITYILTILTRIALAHPHVGFSVIHNGKDILHLPSHQNTEQRIASLLGNVISEETIPIEYEAMYGKISGYITRPQAAERTRQNQHLFVNKRSIVDYTLANIITESYGSLLEPRSFPPFVVHISLPYEHVDVNIHPRKEEVAFINPREIKQLIQNAVQQSLEKHDLTYKERTPTDEFRMDRNTASILKELVSPWNLKSDGTTAILQIKNLYLVTLTDNGLLIVDQHAAHERILFEQFKDTFISHAENPSIYTLNQPVVFNLSVSESQILKEELPLFLKLGFDIEYFGDTSFKLSTLPEIYKNRNFPSLIKEVLLDISTGNKKQIDRETERTLSFLACRTAIKSGEPLSDVERKNLVEKLLESKTLYTCPHGRPTHIELPLTQLDKMFKRS